MPTLQNLCHTIRTAAGRGCANLHAFTGDRRGAVAIIFAIASIAIVEIVGAAVDYGNVYRIKALLNSRVDAASLAAVSSASLGYQTASAMTSDGVVPIAADAAVRMFNAEPSKSGFSISTLSASAAKANNALTATVSYRAEVRTMFLGLIGLPTITISGHSTASNGLPAYIDFTMLLDNSPSMGVAATPADIATMVANTPDQCAFACHDQSTSNNYYNLAKRLGVTTRIDVLRQATQQLMTTAAGSMVVPQQFRFEVDTFNMSVQTIASLTTDLASVETQAAAIDLMPVPFQNWNNDQITDFKTVMHSVNTQISAPGSGNSPSNPQKVLFLVTDGVADYAQGVNRVISPMDPTWCTAIKARGVKIAILYTTYLPLPTNAYYNAHVAPISANIGPSLKTCASPDYYFEVSMNQGISDAMNALFLKVVNAARITN